LRLVDVFAARRRIAPYVRRTPLAASPWLSDLAAADVALKLESSQVSNAFKARGAFNAVIARLERGHAAPKVFKVGRFTLPPRATVPLRATFSLAVHTTRVPRPGVHAVDVIVNGQARRAGSFVVTAARPRRAR